MAIATAVQHKSCPCVMLGWGSGLPLLHWRGSGYELTIWDLQEPNLQTIFTCCWGFAGVPAAAETRTKEACYVATTCWPSTSKRPPVEASDISLVISIKAQTLVVSRLLPESRARQTCRVAHRASSMVKRRGLAAAVHLLTPRTKLGE
jgi:hypothetical protein